MHYFFSLNMSTWNGDPFVFYPVKQILVTFKMVMFRRKDILEKG